MSANDPGSNFQELVDIIAKLRDPVSGCPWDKEQTHQSLKPYMAEEAYEAIDAIDIGPENLKEELGDVLLQVVLHSQVAKDSGTFDINQVVRGLSQKLVERHPHVFGEAKVSGSSEVLRNWEQIKQAKSDRPKGLLAGIPRSMPALLKSHKIGEKVARVDFDWGTTEEVCTKITEELNEFLVEFKRSPESDATKEELGDLMFCFAQLARKLGASAEDILQAANSKFMNRFEQVEKLAGDKLNSLGLEALGKLWAEVKAREKTSS